MQSKIIPDAIQLKVKHVNEHWLSTVTKEFPSYPKATFSAELIENDFGEDEYYGVLIVDGLKLERVNLNTEDLNTLGHQMYMVSRALIDARAAGYRIGKWYAFQSVMAQVHSTVFSVSPSHVDNSNKLYLDYLKEQESLKST